MGLSSFFFKYRSYTPIPLLLVMLYQSQPRIPWLAAGLVILIIGELIRFWGVLYAGGATRTRDVGAPDLVTNGPFAHVRNPLYTGNILIYIGIVLFAGGDWMWYLLIVAIAFFTLQYALIISLEENTLTDLFGEAYREYKRHVPRILPRMTPWTNRDAENATQRLEFGQALRPEKSTLLNITVVLSLILLKWLIIAVR